MPTNTSRASYDTFISEQYPTTNYGSWANIHLSAGTGTRRFGYIYFAGMPPYGSTILSATLSLWLTGVNWSGTNTITVSRVTDSWSESKITWSRSHGGADHSTSHQATATVTDGVDGQRVDIDVSAMMADIAAGTPWYGFFLEVSTPNTGAQLNIRSSESTDTTMRPRLTVNYSRPPDAPTDLAPGGGASVSFAKPTLKWVFTDPDGDDQSEYQVQICADSTFATTEYDTGWITDTDKQLDLSVGATRTASVTTTSASATITTASAVFDSNDVGASITGPGIPDGTTITAVASGTSATMSASATASGTVTATITRTYAGVAAGATRYWRVRVRDVNGLTSDWSATASFMRTDKGTLTISNPPDGGYVEETTPPITTTLTVRDQDVIAYELEEDQGGGEYKQVWASGRFAAPVPAGTAFSYSLPAGKLTKNGTNYRLTVWAYDTVDREATPGDPAYVMAQSVFTFRRSTVPAPVDTMTAVQRGPGVTFTFTRTTQPDYFALRVDDVIVFDRLDPASLLQSANNFLTGDTSEFEASTGTWTNKQNASYSRTTAQAHSGTGSLMLSSIASGAMQVASSLAGNIATTGMPVSPGSIVTVKAWFRAATTGRACDVGAEFYDSTGTVIGAPLRGSQITSTTTGWTQATASLAPPAGAAYCRAVVRVLATAAAGEQHYVDTVWMDSGSSAYTLSYYGCAPNTSHTFEIEAVVADSGVLKHSENNPVVTAALPLSSMWLIEETGKPYGPGQTPRMVRIDGQDPQDFTIGESSSVYYPIGRRDPVTIVDSIRGLEGTISGTITEDANGYVESFRWMKSPEQAGRTWRLVYGQVSMPVQYGAAHLTPLPYGADAPVFAVSIDVVQVGGFDD